MTLHGILDVSFWQAVLIMLATVYQFRERLQAIWSSGGVPGTGSSGDRGVPGTVYLTEFRGQLSSGDSS